MPPRLTDIYRPGQRVEVYFADPAVEDWRPGRVLALEHPGIWVQTADGGLWFVTNRKRIRSLAAGPSGADGP